MIRDRGFEVTEDTLEMNRMTEVSEGLGVAMLKPLSDKKEVGLAAIRNLVKEAENRGITYVILAIQDGLSKQAKQYLPTLNIHMEYWLFDELKYNPTRHYLVPRHKKISREDFPMQIKEGLTLEEALPKILHTDKIARYYNFQKGDLIQVDRTIPTPHTFYRIVQ